MKNKILDTRERISFWWLWKGENIFKGILKLVGIVMTSVVLYFLGAQFLAIPYDSIFSFLREFALCLWGLAIIIPIIAFFSGLNSGTSGSSHIESEGEAYYKSRTDSNRPYPGD